MKKQIYLREYMSGKQYLLVLLRKAIQMGIRGYEGVRVSNNGKDEEDWFIAESQLSKGLVEGTIVRIQ